MLKSVVSLGPPCAKSREPSDRGLDFVGAVLKCAVRPKPVALRIWLVIWRNEFPSFPVHSVSFDQSPCDLQNSPQSFTSLSRFRSSSEGHYVITLSVVAVVVVVVVVLVDIEPLQPISSLLPVNPVRYWLERGA